MHRETREGFLVQILLQQAKRKWLSSAQQGKQAAGSNFSTSPLRCRDAAGGTHCPPCDTGSGCEHPASHCAAPGTRRLTWLHQQSGELLP